MRLKYISAILLGSFFINGCDSKSNQQTTEASVATAEQNTTGNTASSANGKEIYDKECKSCHGTDGKMKALGKSNPIAGTAAESIVKDMKEYQNKTLDKHGMGNVMNLNASRLKENEIKAVAEYIASLKK